MPLPGPFGLPGSPPTWFFPRPAAPPFTLTNNFEGGTPGTTITPANSGGISGDAASAITFNGTGAVVRFSDRDDDDADPDQPACPGGSPPRWLTDRGSA